MSTIFRLIKAFFSIPSQQQDDEAYLAQAVDIYDLERRMNEIDLGSRHAPQGMQYGVVRS